MRRVLQAHQGTVAQGPLVRLVLLGHQYQVQVGSLVLKGGEGSMAGLVNPVGILFWQGTDHFRNLQINNILNLAVKLTLDHV